MAKSNDRFLMEVSSFNIQKKNGSSIGQYLKQLILDERLNNWLGMLYAIVVGILVALLFALKGLKIGAILIGGLVSIPVMFAVIFNPLFGVIFVISGSFVLLGIKRMSPEIPVGLFTDVMIVLLAFSVFYHNIQKRDWDFAKGAISTMVIIYMIYVFASILNPGASCPLCYIFTIRSMAGYMIMYFIVSFVIQDKKHIKLLIKVWLFFAVLAALYALKQEFIGLSGFEQRWVHASPERYWLLFQWGQLRKFSFLGDPASFGITMGYSAIIPIVLFFGRTPIYKKLLLALMAGIILYAMLFSGTRSAYVVLPIGAVLFVLLIKNKKIILFSITAAILFLALVFSPFYIHPLFSRVRSTFYATEDPSYQIRLENQRRIRPWIWEHPIGGGLGATGTIGQQYDPTSFLAGFPPDSGYVRIAVELGWVGLTLYILLWLVIFKQGIDSYFKIRDPSMKFIALSMLCVLFGLFVVNYVQDIMKQLPTSLLFWVATAIVSRGSQLDMDTEDSSTETSHILNRINRMM